MKKFMLIIGLLFILILNNINISNAFTQTSTTQESSVLGVDDILTHIDHNKIVTDIQRMIVDIGGLKNYVDANLISVWTMENGKLTYDAKNVFFGKNLLVGGTISTNKINIPLGSLKQNVIVGTDDIKNEEVKTEDLNQEVFDSVKPTFRLNGLNTYYNNGNVGIGTNAPSELLTVNGNVKIIGTGKGVIFPDGSVQNSAIINDTNNVKLTGDQNISGIKKFLNSIRLAFGPAISIISDDRTFTNSRDNAVVTERAIKTYANAELVKKNRLCGGDNGGTFPFAYTNKKVRYIRDYINGSNINTGNHWVEVQAIGPTGTNLASGKTVTLTAGTVNTANASYTIPGLLTDRNTGTPPYFDVNPGLVSVVIDLGSSLDVSQIKVWHYYLDSRKYNATKTQISVDGTTWETLYDSAISGTYTETSAGAIYTLPSVKTVSRTPTNLCMRGTAGIVTNVATEIPSASCLEVKEKNMAAASGIYTIYPNGTALSVYCDMTTDGGGWTLVGRGRDGWNWNNSGKDVGNVTLNIGTTSAFVPAYYSAATINGMIKGLALNTLSSGVRIKRATNTTGTTFQEARWNFSALPSWSWTFDTGLYPLSSVVINGTNYTTVGNSNDYLVTNDANRFFTWGRINHNNVIGFAFGQTMTGTNSATNFLRNYTNEGHALPYTEVYVRSRAPIANTRTSQTGFSWICSGISGGSNASCTATLTDPFKNIQNVGGERQWSDRTYAKSCYEYKNPPNSAYQYQGDTGSGIYKIKPLSTLISVFCDMDTDGGGWTMAYKSAGQHTMKTVGEQNIVTLKDNTYGGVGKLDDTVIKAIYVNQYRIDYNGYTSWYCKFNSGVSSYADNVISPKNCRATYSADASGYTTLASEASRSRGFSTRRIPGSRILQLNYQDARFGSHVVNGAASANTCDVKTSGADRYGCSGKVWIK